MVRHVLSQLQDEKGLTVLGAGRSAQWRKNK